MKQHEVVFKVLKELGGYATLAQLYERVPVEIEFKSNSLTPHKTINRIVQERPEIFKIRPGLWGLETMRKRVPQDLFLKVSGKVKREDTARGHSYYQGLLLEVGRYKNMNTYVPAQDKRHLFTHSTLGELASLSECPDFGYPKLVSRAKMVDVTWFNPRKMPSAFFEVEHSTDMQNSMTRFVDLQDYNVRFCIVADEVRKREFEKKVSFEAFRDIRGRVDFLSYEQLALWHTSSAALHLIESRMR